MVLQHAVRYHEGNRVSLKVCKIACIQSLFYTNIFSASDVMISGALQLCHEVSYSN